MRSHRWWFALIVVSGCLDLSVPPLPGPGSVSGRVVAVPIGRSGLEPVPNARVELLGTGLVTTSDTNGFFRINGVVREVRQALFRVDVTSDGRADRSKLLTLDATRVGPGKQVSLGDVVLAENAVVTGRVLRGDVPTDRGHAGILVFVPEGPFTATSSDDGSYAFDQLPEGTLSIAFFRAGYRPAGLSSLTLMGGIATPLRTVTLEVDPTVPVPVGIAGRVRLASGAVAAAATVVVASPTTMKAGATADDGTFDLNELPPGVYSVTASREGATSARVSNVLVTSGRVTLPDLVLGELPMTGTGGGTAGGGLIEGPGGGAAGGTSGGVAGGIAGGVAGGIAGGVAGGTAGGVAGGIAGGVAGGTSGGVAGGTAGGTAGGAIIPMRPPPPTNLTAIAGNAQVTLTFSPSPGATSYRAYWATQAPVSMSSTTLGTVASPALHQGLTNGTTYFYVVTAVNAVGESLPSAVAQATPLAQPTTTTPEVLSRRPDRDATAVRISSRIDVRVDRDLDGTTATPTNVRLELLDGGVVPASVAAAGPTLTVTPSSLLAFESPYRVTLGTGLRSATGTPLSTADSWTFTTGSPPPALSGFLGNSSNQLTWTSVRDAQHSVVTRTVATTRTTFTVVGNVFRDDSLSNGVEHAYTVQAVTPFGLSAPSAEVRLRPSPARPAPPTSVSVLAGATTALLSWSAVNNVTGYSIYRGPAAGGPFTLLRSNWPATHYLDTGRPTDTPVAYVVQSEALGGVSTYSTAAVDVTRAASLAAPAGLTATAGDRWTRLTWNPVPGAAGYLVYSFIFPNGPLQRTGWVTDRPAFDHLPLTNGETYQYFVAASVDGFVGDLAEASSSPLPGLPLAPVRMRAPDPGVNLVTLSATSPIVGTPQFFRSSSPDGGFQAVPPTVTVDGGERWFYAARAVQGAAVSELSGAVEATAVAFGLPPAPMNVTALAATQAAEVTWSATPLATSYRVGRSVTSGGPYTELCFAGDGLETRCGISLTDNQLVYLAVRAYNGSTPGPWSAELAVRPTNLPPAPGLPRPTVTVAEGNGTMTVSWLLVPAATEYRVFRRTRTTPWALHRTTSQLGFEEAVPNGLEVQYGVLAAVPATSRFSVMTPTAFVQASADLPFRPTGLRVIPTNGGAAVTWLPVAGHTAVRVFASVLPGSAPAGTEATCFSDGVEPCQLTLPNGTTYVVAARATAPGGLLGSWTPEVTVTPNLNAPPAPDGMTIIAGNGALSLESGGVPGAAFKLFRRTESTPYVEVDTYAAPFIEEAPVNGVRTTYRLQQTTPQGTSPMTGAAGSEASHLRPLVPSIVSVVPGTDRLAVQWTPVPGATGYWVVTAPSANGPFVNTSIFGDADNTRGIVLVSVPTTRFLAVRATGAQPLGGTRSVAVSGAVSSAAVGVPSLSWDVGSQAIELSWNAVASATGYLISRRVVGGADFRPVASLTGQRFVDQNVEPGESFVYHVQAVGPQGPGPWAQSTVLNASASQPPLVRNVTLRPGNASATVEWAPVPGVSGYSVRTDTSPTGAFASPGCSLANAGEFETRCRISGTNGVPVFVVVNAVQANVPGAGSPTPISATPDAMRPGTPSLLTPQGMGPGRLQVSFTTVTGATGYRIFRRTNALPWTLVQTTTMTSWLDMGLTSGTRYFYTVEAENAAGLGATSNSASLLAP